MTHPDASMPDSVRNALACPKCRGVLADISGSNGKVEALECRNCRLRYPIRDGIPVLLGEAGEGVTL